VLTEYLNAALERAHYELIQDEEPFYGQVNGLQGVWATGKTLEECRRNLADAIEDWVFFSIAKGLPVPQLGDAIINLPAEVMN
jgi:predicted RNase H-like HicB family nuclease